MGLINISMSFSRKAIFNFFLIIALIIFPKIISADEVKIFIAKEILTLNSRNDSVEAVATQGSKIINLGSKEELTSIYPNADLINNYENSILVPGFIEHHIHPFLAAVTMNSEIFIFFK